MKFEDAYELVTDHMQGMSSVDDIAGDSLREDDIAMAQATDIYEKLLNIINRIPAHVTKGEQLLMLREQLQTICFSDLYAYLFMSSAMDPTDWPDCPLLTPAQIIELRMLYNK